MKYLVWQRSTTVCTWKKSKKVYKKCSS